MNIVEIIPESTQLLYSDLIEQLNNAIIKYDDEIKNYFTLNKNLKYKLFALENIILGIKYKPNEKTKRFMIPQYLDEEKINMLFQDMFDMNLISIKYIYFESSKKNESFDIEWFDNKLILDYVEMVLK